MSKEELMNNYYNIGGFNRPDRIGYMLNMIRKLRPLTMEEWRTWYLSNVHDEAYLYQLAVEMQGTIPASCGVSVENCEEYIYDVMFRRTFQGYDKEKQALKILRDKISPSVQEAPKEWDTEYFIDFYVQGAGGLLIGIQLKPDTFYHGHYETKVGIEGKMKRFEDEYKAKTYVLQYKSGGGSGIAFVNPEMIGEIKELL